VSAPPEGPGASPVRTARVLYLAAMAPVAAAVAMSLAYWPGLVTWDSIRQYDQALSGQIDDWHPPVMEWIWRQLIPLDPSPAPMLLLQLGLFAAGLVLLAIWALRRQRHGLAFAIGCCALPPISAALMGTIVKDSLMTGALLAAAGLLATGGRHSVGWPRWLAITLVLFAASLRFNAFLAGLPLLLALLPRASRSSRVRTAVSMTIAFAALLLVMPMANAMIGAEHSGVELSLITFDLGGITRHSGVDAFPKMGFADVVGINRRCYSPVKWDSYSWWVDEPCPIGFFRVRRAFRRNHINPQLHWVRQIAAHPLAYAEHRLSHWNINARFIVRDEIERPVQVEAPPNDWKFHTTKSRALSWIDDAAVLSARTPLGWPCAWMALALGILFVSRQLPSRALVAPLSASALLYGMGYLVFSVAAELRYYLWTMVATAIAFVIAASDLSRLDGDGRITRWAALAGPALVVSAVCVAARLLG